MVQPASVEIIGFRNSECGPFPCDESRTCGLTRCHPTNRLLPAFDALKARLEEEYGGRITVTLTLLDDGIPSRIKEIINDRHPPLPIVLVGGGITPIGRISVDLLKKEIDRILLS